VGTYLFGVLQSPFAASRLSARIIVRSAAAPAAHKRAARDRPSSAAQGTGLVTRSGPARVQTAPPGNANHAHGPWPGGRQGTPCRRTAPASYPAGCSSLCPRPMAAPTRSRASPRRRRTTARNDTQQDTAPRRPACMPRPAGQHASRHPRNACPELGDHYFHATTTICGIAGRHNPDQHLAKASRSQTCPDLSHP
jgi:hypothetical protein